MKTEYHTHDLQRTYFVIDTYEQLFQTVRELRWDQWKTALGLFPTIEQGMILDNNELFQQETP